MILIIFLCFFATVVVSANNVIPLQTYPIYQQNGYTNPTASPPNNLQPYTQGVITQNQLQQLNISPSLIKQAVLNKLLTSPSVQTILDANAGRYGSNLVRMQNNQVPVNLVSISAPTEYVKNNSSNANMEGKSNDSKNTEKGKQGKRRRSKSKRKHNDTQKMEENSNKSTPMKEEYTSIIENITENYKNSRKNTRKHNTKNAEPKQDVESDSKKPKRRKTKQKEQTTVNPVEEENKDQSTKTRKRRRKQKVNETSQPEDLVNTKPKEIKDNVNLDITDDAMDNENRRTRNLNLEAKDLLKSAPDTPKEMNNKFLANMNQFNNPLMSNWFANYENLYQSLLANQQTAAERRPKTRRKPKKIKKPKRKLAQNNNGTEISSVTTPNEFSIDSTTERTIYINQQTKLNINSNPTEQIPKSFDNDDGNLQSSNEIFKDGYNINEFQERYDTDFYGGYIDDYYPLFADNAAYNANNKEIILKNLNDNKYYYATDRIETDTTKQNLINDLKKQELVNIEKYKHSYDETEKETIRNAYEKELEEIIQFKSPPFLESPDFRTKEIDRSKIKPEVYYTFDDNLDRFNEPKSSYSSSTKTPYNTRAKPNEIKQKIKDVETVYARSKVVSYGPVYSPSEDSYSAASNDDHSSWIDTSSARDTFQNDGTSYVLAKSFEMPELY